MFERYLTEALTRHFGHVVDGLDSDKVRISAWRGELVMKDVTLKKDALDNLFKSKSPIEIAHGHVGHLQVRIPWQVVRQFLWRASSSSSSEPEQAASLNKDAFKCSVVLTDVNILVTPRRKAESSSPPQSGTSTTRESNGHLSVSPEQKEEDAQALLDSQLLSRCVTKSSESESRSSRWKWMTDYVAEVLSNLAVTVRKVHFRYEDPGSSMGFEWSCSQQHQYRQPFAVGMTLEQFSICTPPRDRDSTKTPPDSNASPDGSSDDTGKMWRIRRKVIETKQLAVYWDSDCELMSTSTEHDETGRHYESLFHFLSTQQSETPPQLQQPLSDTALRPLGQPHSFILDPLSPSVQISLVREILTEDARRAAIVATVTHHPYNGINPAIPPPSTLNAELPPCHFSISKSLLQDLTYLRQCFELWSRTSAHALPDEMMQRLIRLRPQEPPMTNPRGWWVYAFEVVLAIQAVEATSEISGRRRKCDWLSLSRALGLRRRYISLYGQFISATQESNLTEQDAAHSSLQQCETEMTIDEMVAFRIAAYFALKSSLLEQASAVDGGIRLLQPHLPRENGGGSEGDGISDSVSDNGPTLSAQHRLRMFAEMARTLHAEESMESFTSQTQQKEQQVKRPRKSVDESRLDASKSKAVIWVSTLRCPEMSLQVNDRPSRNNELTTNPVVRLSSAFVLDHRLCRDGAWNLTNQIGSLCLKDCTASDLLRTRSGSRPEDEAPCFPFLIGPKGGKPLETDCTLTLNGVKHHRSVLIRVQRSGRSSDAERSETSTQVRVLPLEIVYCTAPWEALTRIVSAAASVELTKDYHRLSTRILAWRERQQKRLLRALAHKKKQVLLDVDVGAPVVLIPEKSSNRDSPLLIIDLGRLQFRNDQNRFQFMQQAVDDNKWHLGLTDIQVQCSTTQDYRNAADIDAAEDDDPGKLKIVELPEGTTQVIEPFTLDFSISTRFMNGDIRQGGAQAEDGLHVAVIASLPLLVFNTTSSALRLLKRLQLQWTTRKLELERPPPVPARAQRSFSTYRRQETLPDRRTSDSSAAPLSEKAGSATETGTSIGTFEFHFSAPLLRMRFQNDVDGRDSRWGADDTSALKTPICDLSIRDVFGQLHRENYSRGSPHVKWNARLRSLDAIDRYQAAGKGFAYLLSSVSPESPRPGGSVRNLRAVKGGSEYVDLVVFSFDSDGSVERSDRAALGLVSAAARRVPSLSIRFHELYVNWNPETLAALQHALKLPATRDSDTVRISHRQSASSADDDDVFFDAAQDDFHDAATDEARNEVTSSGGVPIEFLALASSSAARKIILAQSISTSTVEDASRSTSKPKPFATLFELTKLRVNFNKESRHRRLLIAEMDGTRIKHCSRTSGGSTTTATIGNLVFSDAESVQNKTLYKEIIGLKTDSTASSILELEMTRCPRSRQYVSNGCAPTRTSDDEGVVIDCTSNRVIGADFCLKAKFSPMRFVYLQQLWFEVVDYFFEGIIGTEVWGMDRQDIPSPSHGCSDNDAPLAEDVTFTAFEIVLDAPVIMIPVSYCSTDYIKLDLSALSLKNQYLVSAMRLESSSAGRQQWFNNCDVNFLELSMSSSSGRQLSALQPNPSMRVSLNWPTGPTAGLNSPTWEVGCTLDAMSLELERGDYALLQHIIQFNIGEESRHLDEWHALQKLPPLVVERYKQDIMVYYGYDKKDVTPSTFSVNLCAPSLSIALYRSMKTKTAEVRCESIVWTYRKLRDRVSRQTVGGDVELLDFTTGSSRLLLSARASGNDHGAGLTYSSTIQPSADSVKTLGIVDPQIHIHYVAWVAFSEYFQGLPDPTYLSPEGVIQVGDRWYKISESAAFNPKDESLGSNPRLEWIEDGETDDDDEQASPKEEAYIPPVSHEFRLSMLSPRVVMESEHFSLVLRSDEVGFRHQSVSPIIKRDFSFIGLQIQTLKAKRSAYAALSINDPWSIGGTMKHCNGTSPCRCRLHSCHVDAGLLNVRAAYSDMIAAVEVGLHVASEVNGVGTRSSADSTSNRPSDSNGSPPAPMEYPLEQTVTARWEGFQLLVVDDSGRHFANSQEIVLISLGFLDFSRSATRGEERSNGYFHATQKETDVAYAMRLRLSSCEAYDCLQSESSPFRTILRTRVMQILLPPNFQRGGRDLEAPPSETSTNPSEFAIDLSSKTTAELKSFRGNVRSIDLQYNPSMIIALQRLLGRLHKDVRHSLETYVSVSSRTVSPSTKEGDTVDTPLKTTVSFDVEQVRLSLNKEHQARQLLETIISECHVDLTQNHTEIDVQGHIGTLDAWDNSVDPDHPNHNVLRVGDEHENFVDFQYKKFLSPPPIDDPTDIRIPKWAFMNFDEQLDDKVDDCLHVAVASVDLICEKDKLAELIDYLSNGMPGRGMGATSRAAKGFVQERVETRSLFHIHVETPTFRMPHDLEGESGLYLQLGDFNLRSWVEDADLRVRTLAVALEGLTAGTYSCAGGITQDCPFVAKIEAKAHIDKAPARVAVRSSISEVNVSLKYSDYVTLNKVLRRNLLKKINKARWDNLEVAWEAEAARLDDGDETASSMTSTFSREVVYSVNARHVRYGQSSASDERASSASEFDLSLRCDRVTLLLIRDDEVLLGAATRTSDNLMLISLFALNLAVNARTDAGQSMTASMGKLFVFDVKDRSDKSTNSTDHNSSRGSVIAEGYGVSGHVDGFDSQVVVTLNKTDNDTSVSLVVNYLSLTALRRPLEELTGFLSCEWTNHSPAVTLDKLKSMEASNEEVSEEVKGATPESSRLQLKLVLHYPRLILVADETDRHSRALVLQGLAMINATKTSPHAGSGEDQVTEALRVQGDFQQISSYINPDVAAVVSVQERHNRVLIDAFLTDRMQCSFPEAPVSIDIPLLLPLTLGFEFDQQVFVRAPSTRSLLVNMDSVSAMMSNQDLQLIEDVAKKWSSRSKKSKTQSRTYLFDVEFETERLGLGLVKSGSNIVVDHVGELGTGRAIQSGDVIRAVNGGLAEGGDTSLSSMVERLASEPRPLTLTFARTISGDSRSDLDGKGETSAGSKDVCHGTFDSIDLSVTTATVTLMEKEVTWFRGNMSNLEFGCKLEQTSRSACHVGFSSACNVDYYNLRAWLWEPLMEPGVIGLSADFVDTHRGPRELSIEVGDRSQGPISFNLSDAAIEAFCRFFPKEADDVGTQDDPLALKALGSFDAQRLLLSHHTADAALQFAKRQKRDAAKPFLFRNKTGLSVAVVQQRRTTRQLERSTDFATVGEYYGLEGYCESEISVVANEDESRLHIDVRPGELESEPSQHVNRLMIAFQRVGDALVEPLKDVEVTRLCETNFPLVLVRDGNRPSAKCVTPSIWASWQVEQETDLTVLTLGSSVQVVSGLQEAIEVGVACIRKNKDEHDTTPPDIRTIGTARAEDAIHLPLWLAMQPTLWQCFVRPVVGYNYTLILQSSMQGDVEVVPTFHIECVPLDASKASNIFFSMTTMENNENGSFVATIDCAFVVRNVLPVGLYWEAAPLSSQEDALGQASARSASGFLGSGTAADCLSSTVHTTLSLRIRFSTLDQWSKWIPLTIPALTSEETTASQAPPTVRRAGLLDAFGLPQTVAVRIQRKRGGIEAAVFSELWCANFTSLPLIFGAPQDRTLGRNGEFVNSEGGVSQVSAAESALKEISSLFEPGDEGKGIRSPSVSRSMAGVADVFRLPSQFGSPVVEEVFEYLDMGASSQQRTWWASANPRSLRQNMTTVVGDGREWHWLCEWAIDSAGRTLDGWESSATLDEFSAARSFNGRHRYRRRRWVRKRTSQCNSSVVDGVHAFFHKSSLAPPRNGKSGKEKGERGFRVAVQIEGGRWAITSMIPPHGSVHGALRVGKTRWPPSSASSRTSSFDFSLCELCYAVKPLEGEWGDYSRLLTVTPRFLVRNESKCLTFEVKQSGTGDATAVPVGPMETIPFHWRDFRLPELICVRPVATQGGYRIFRWSGGLDPLTIGAVPLRVRKVATHEMDPGGEADHIWQVRSIKVESEIRPKTGNTGINLTLQEEDCYGSGALFRIENHTHFPIWIAQDGVLANQISGQGPGQGLCDTEGDVVSPSTSVTFALDVPFRQGKYAGRKAATLTELLRARLALAPLSSRAGIETTKVVFMTNVGEKIRLNPSKLTVYTPEIRSTLRRVRVLGLLLNDGPTRVLRFGLMVKGEDTIFSSPFNEDMSATTSSSYADASAKYSVELLDAALTTKNELRKIPQEREAVERALHQSNWKHAMNAHIESDAQESDVASTSRDFLISVRVEFQQIVCSLIDSAPSEICLISLRNVNAFATWNKFQTANSTMYFSVESLQVDNMVPNAPFPVAVFPLDTVHDARHNSERSGDHADDAESSDTVAAPMLVVGVAFAPKHDSEVVCLRSVTVAPRNLAVKVDLAFLVRLQKYAMDAQDHFRTKMSGDDYGIMTVPDIKVRKTELEEAAAADIGRQKFYFGGLTILPCNVKLSVAPARALTQAQAVLEGPEAAAMHHAVRKGDLRIGDSNAAGILGVKVGSRNSTPLAVVRGMLKSFVVDALLRLDGADLNFAGVVLTNHTSTTSQLTTHLVAHYMFSLRQNVPAVLGSLAAFGNPLGLVRGLGDGVSDFVLEPMKGFQKSVQEMDASYLVDGVARGTLSLARHTVGGFADSAAMLTETFSKNMTVLTLDRRYAQKRDRKDTLRDQSEMNVAVGIGSGVKRLAQGFLEGVTGVVKAPLRGAEKRGFEGFAKGVGKGLLGLLVKPIIGISDGITAVMIGVKGSVEGATQEPQIMQIRPRRAIYGTDRVIRPYNFADAAAAALMMRTRLAGEYYHGHLDMGDRVALLSTKRLLLLGPEGQELLVLRYKNIESLEVRSTKHDERVGWSIIILLNTPRNNGSEIEVISSRDEAIARALVAMIEEGIKYVSADYNSAVPRLKDSSEGGLRKSGTKR